jgi:predicted ATP-grasp superfamily ATP-dependent carboligase
MKLAAAAGGQEARRTGPAAGGTVDAIVTDTNLRAGVAGVRALAGAGLEVCALAATRRSAGLWSRHADVRALGPTSLEDPGGFVARVGALAAERGPCVVFPSLEETLDPLVAAIDVLPEKAIVPYPGPGPLHALRDKSALPDLVRDAGLVTPESLGEGTVAELLAAPPPTPCVVKTPGKSPVLPDARVARTADELTALLTSLPPDEQVLVQEHAGGPLVGLALVLDRAGAVVARFQQTADLLWPIGAGGSRRATSVAPDPELVDAGARLLRHAGFWGLAQLQYLSTRRGPALIDVNPRFYGSLPLATAAGVNLPAAWHAVTLGGPPAPETPYRVGVSYRWLEGEIAAAFRGDVRELFDRPPAPRSGAIWASDDPVPSTILAVEAAWARVGRRLSRG